MLWMKLVDATLFLSLLVFEISINNSNVLNQNVKETSILMLVSSCATEMMVV